jgi:hypothetical protein
LLPALKALPNNEKVREVDFLQAELAREQGEFPFPPGLEVPIWSPFDAYEAAAVMTCLIEQDKMPILSEG